MIWAVAAICFFLAVLLLSVGSSALHLAPVFIVIGVGCIIAGMMNDHPD